MNWSHREVAPKDFPQTGEHGLVLVWKANPQCVPIVQSFAVLVVLAWELSTKMELAAWESSPVQVRGL